MSQVLNGSLIREADLDSKIASHVLAYPGGTPAEFAQRIAEARSLGIESILTGGPTLINGTAILGKGCVGLVVKARHSEKGICALKVRRTDADRKDMSREASLHAAANELGVGPRIHIHSNNFLVMDLVKGEKISTWASGHESKRAVKDVTKSILNQCYRLDTAGLDHGELSRISNHVLISGNSPTIIDFESASTSRKVANVTSAVQALFLFGKVAAGIACALGRKPNQNLAIAALRRYKTEISRSSLDTLVWTLLSS